MANRFEVEAYSATVRRLVERRQVVFIMRPKNADALLALGMNRQAAIFELLRLKAESYSSGPEEDRDRAGQQCWVFGQEVSGVEIYIKLVIENLSGGRQRLKVLSYHQAEWVMRYPFR